jgi:ATP-binding cassette subfamily B protein
VQERAEMERFAALNRDLHPREPSPRAHLRGCFNPLLQALVGIGFLMVLWMGGLRLAAHKITLGSFVMFNTYVGLWFGP